MEWLFRTPRDNPQPRHAMLMKCQGAERVTLIRHCCRLFQAYYPDGQCLVVVKGDVNNVWKGEPQVAACSWSNLLAWVIQTRAHPSPSRRLIIFTGHGRRTPDQIVAMTAIWSGMVGPTWTFLEWSNPCTYPHNFPSFMHYRVLFQFKDSDYPYNAPGWRGIDFPEGWIEFVFGSCAEGQRALNKLCRTTEHRALFVYHDLSQTTSRALFVYHEQHGSGPLSCPPLPTGCFLQETPAEATRALKAVLAQNAFQAALCSDVVTLVLQYL